jgi:NADPH:quinone reductase-like Zn-dependent oxidoreductase
VKAAVVAEAGRAPQWSDFEDPIPAVGETFVTVAAAALSPIVRARAAGRHYSSEASGRFVAGVDGVGRLEDGRRVYFAFPRAPFGSMAQFVPVPLELFTEIPDDLDDVTAAALANPAMSSWAALRDRAKFEHGESVLVNGATGAAGKLAVQICKHLGAKRIVATGRTAEQLEPAKALGAHKTIPLTLPDDELVDTLCSAMIDDDVTIVLDYLWGSSAQHILTAIARNHAGDSAPRIRFVQIGAVSGAEIPLDAGLLRGSGVELLGSGLRSVPLGRLVSGIGEALAVAGKEKFAVDTVARPMETVESSWNEDTGTCRLVFTLPAQN